jgi:glycopeptide antibiotics resistance protein
VGGLTSSERSRLPFVLWIVSIAFIVYGTTIPFNFIHDWQQVADHLARVTWNPLIAADTGQRVSIPDVVGNVLLFVPFGLFGVWALSWPRGPWGRLALVTIFGLALTIGAEALQLLTVDRTTAGSDVFANTLGALIGGVAAVFLTTFAETFVRTVSAAGLAQPRSFFPLLMATIVVVAGALEPFDVTIDVGGVIAKVRALIANPLQFNVPVDEGLSFLQHLLFTATLVAWFEDIDIDRPGMVAMLVGIVVTLCAEGGQLFISARMPGLWDAGIGIAGALAGVQLGAIFRRSPRSPLVWSGVLALTAVGVAMQQLSPFTLADDSRAFQWIPFLNYYDFTSGQTVSHSAELLLAYFPLGFVFALSARRRRHRFRAVFAAALMIAVPVEYLQMFIGGRFPDVTDVALSVGGAWLGGWAATTGWRLFDEQIALVSPARAVGAPLTARQ